MSPSPLGHRFWLLASARTISVGGNGFGRVALAFGVLALPHAGPGELSLVLACQALPQLVLILIGGVLADRMSRGRLMLMAEVIAALSWGGLALVISQRSENLWLVCLLAVIAGSASSMFSPAMSGVVPELVAKPQLQQANAVIRMAQSIAMMTGLGLSGLVVAFFGAPAALGLNAASFAVSGVLIAALRVPNPSRPPSHFITDLKDGWRDFRSRQWLWVVVAQFAIVVAAVNAMVGVLGPLYALDAPGGATAWGIIVAAQALGSFAGAGLSMKLRSRRPIRSAVIVTFMFAVPMVFLALGVSVWWCAAAMFLSGVTNDIFGVLWTTTMQNHIPRELLSRVSAYDQFGSLALAPLGLIVAGPIASIVGVRASLIGCAVLVVVATGAALFSRDVRMLAAEPEPVSR